MDKSFKTFFGMKKEPFRSDLTQLPQLKLFLRKRKV